MASEVGGASLNIQVGDGTPSVDQFNEISSFIKGFFDTQLGVVATKKGGFEQVLGSDTNKELHVFGNDNPGKVAKFKGGQDGIVGTGEPTKIKGGSGDNDILITDNASHKVNLGAGDDTLLVSGSGPVNVKAGSGNDSVTGGSGNDIIKGQGGNDTLEGRGGDDVLSGGGGKDIFAFGTGPTGSDRITDFKKGDILAIADRTGATNNNNIQTDGTIVSVTDDGQGNTIIELKGGDKIQLDNVKSSELAFNGDGNGGIGHI